MTKEEREPWDLMAMRDRARFRYEMANYDGPMKILKGSKVDKDPNAPKRPTSAFLAYSKAKRPAIMAEHPTLRTTQVSVILSGMWKEEDPAVKQYYTDQVNAQLKIYKKKAREHKQAVASAAQKRETEAMEHAMEAGFNNPEVEPCLERGFNNPEVEPVHAEPTTQEDSGHIVGSEMDPMLDGLTADEVDLCFESNNFEWDPIPLANDTSLTALEHPMQQEPQPEPPASVSPMQQLQQQTPQKQKPKTPKQVKAKKPRQVKPKKQKQPRKVQTPKVPDLEVQPTTVVPGSESVFWRPSVSPHLSHMNRAVAASLQHAMQQGPSTPPGSLMPPQLQQLLHQQQLMLNQHHQQLLQQYRQIVRPSTPQAPAFWGGTTPPHPMGHAVSVTPDQPTRQMVLFSNNGSSPQVTTMVAPSCVQSQPHGSSPPGMSTPPGHQWVLVQTLPPPPPNLNNLSTPPPLGFLQQAQQMAAQQQQHEQQTAPWTATWSSGNRNNAAF